MANSKQHCYLGLRRRSLGGQGFTLIELLVAMVIVSILSAIAFPSYQNYIRRTNRADAKGVLLETAQFLERNYTMNGCYHRINPTDCTAAADVVLPYAHSPRSGEVKYNVTVAYPAVAPCTLGSCYTLSAAPAGTMAGDACGTYTLTNTGAQDNTGLSGGMTVDTCWNR